MGLGSLRSLAHSELIQTQSYGRRQRMNSEKGARHTAVLSKHLLYVLRIRIQVNLLLLNALYLYPLSNPYLLLIELSLYPLSNPYLLCKNLYMNLLSNPYQLLNVLYLNSLNKPYLILNILYPRS